tara:strand:- start:22711 stop:23472 length:762 start_codon:yes stop_codon:yes gene_type:complete
MLRVRIIPCLQLLDENLVKTVRFKKPNYIGDFVNTAKIFNELEVDELCLLGIRVTLKNGKPDFTILEQVAKECFMPLSYGGGICDFDVARKILSMGFEKVVLNSVCFENLNLITKISEHFGAQSIIVAIDAKKDFLGKERVYSHSGQKKHSYNACEWAQIVEEKGAGEILLTSINNEGTWQGFNMDLCQRVSDSVEIPVIAHGGGVNVESIGQVVKIGKASAVGLGSMVVYQKKGMGVLINFPDYSSLQEVLV